MKRAFAGNGNFDAVSIQTQPYRDTRLMDQSTLAITELNNQIEFQRTRVSSLTSRA